MPGIENNELYVYMKYANIYGSHTMKVLWSNLSTKEYKEKAQHKLKKEGTRNLLFGETTLLKCKVCFGIEGTRCRGG